MAAGAGGLDASNSDVGFGGSQLVRFFAMGGVGGEFSVTKEGGDAAAGAIVRGVVAAAGLVVLGAVATFVTGSAARVLVVTMPRVAPDATSLAPPSGTRGCTRVNCSTPANWRLSKRVATMCRKRSRSVGNIGCVNLLHLAIPLRSLLAVGALSDSTLHGGCAASVGNLS